MSTTEHINVKEYPQTVEVLNGQTETVWYFEICKPTAPGEASLVELGQIEHKGAAFVPIRDVPFVEVPYAVSQALKDAGYKSVSTV